MKFSFNKFFRKYKILILSSILIIIGIILSMNMWFSKSDSDEIKEITYNEFIDLVNENKVDIVYYNKGNEFMYAALFNEETKSMSYPDRLEYVYTNKDKVRVSYPANENFRQELLSKNVRLEVMSVEGAGIWSTLANLLTTLILYIIVFAIIFKLFAVVMNPVGNSKNEIVSSDKRFSDVIGHDEIIEDLQFITELIKNPKKGEKIGVKAPKGLLLEGPPGCGKTLIAKAIAGEADVPFIEKPASKFIETYVGVGARRVRDLFKKAKEIAPCVIFIDEFDAIGKPRGSNKNSMENDQTINQLLTEMDGFASSKGILVIAATNHSDDLDPAIIRSGRFDRRIVVSPPKDWTTRKELFEYYLKNYTYDKNMDLDGLSKSLSGFTGADIEVVVNEASIRAVMKDLDMITYDCIIEAIDIKIFKGNYSKNKANEQDQKLVAYHEAGHAVMSYLLGEPIARASIQATISGVGGAVFNEDKESKFITKTDFENKIKIAYGGRASEQIKFNEITTGASNDIQQATTYIKNYIKTYGFDDELGLINYNDNDELIQHESTKIFDKMSKYSIKFYNETLELLKANYNKVEIIANKLIESNMISGDEINKLLED